MGITNSDENSYFISMFGLSLNLKHLYLIVSLFGQPQYFALSSRHHFLTTSITSHLDDGSNGYRRQHGHIKGPLPNPHSCNRKSIGSTRLYIFSDFLKKSISLFELISSSPFGLSS